MRTVTLTATLLKSSASKSSVLEHSFICLKCLANHMRETPSAELFYKLESMSHNAREIAMQGVYISCQYLHNCFQHLNDRDLMTSLSWGPVYV